MKLFVIAIIFVGSIGTLISVGIVQRGVPQMQFRELIAAGSEYEPGSKVHVGQGRVVEVVARAPDLRFRYGDPEHPESSILVESTKNAPDNFKVGVGASLKGSYDPEARVFKAYEVATNCPSKYDAKDEVEQYERRERLKTTGESVGASVGASVGETKPSRTDASGVLDSVP